MYRYTHFKQLARTITATHQKKKRRVVDTEEVAAREMELFLHDYDTLQDVRDLMKKRMEGSLSEVEHGSLNGYFLSLLTRGNHAILRPVLDLTVTEILNAGETGVTVVEEELQLSPADLQILTE